MSQAAVQYPVPTNWRVEFVYRNSTTIFIDLRDQKPSFDSDPQLSRARAALEKNIQSTNPTPLQPIMAYQMTEYDRLSNAPPQYNSTVFSLLTSLKDQNPGFANQFVRVESSCTAVPFTHAQLCYSPTLPSSGYAATKAFMVYGEPKYLDLAKEAWQTASAYTISPSQAQMGSIPGKNFTLQNSCGGASMAGGTFYETDEDYKTLDVNASGWVTLSPNDDFYWLTGTIDDGQLFLNTGTILWSELLTALIRVSGLLGNATGDSTYLDAASLSFQFLSTQLYNHVTGQVMSSIIASTCTANPTGTLVQIAVFLEGATILGEVTGNETTKAFAQSLVQKAIKDASSDNSQGILQEQSLNPIAQDERGGHFIRALSAVYDADATDGGLRDYIRAFIAVQYNALVDLAGDGDIYAGSWMGPKATYDFANQTTAIDVLLGGLVVANTTANTTDSASPPSMDSPITPKPHKSNVGAIVGGAIGGSIVLFMMMVLLVLIRRQHRRIAAAPVSPEPFGEPSQDSNQPLHRQDGHQNLQWQEKDPMPPPSPSTTLVPRNDSALEESFPLNQNHEESQGITIGSLIWELNELLRRNNRAVPTGSESPPVYTASHSDA